ncbi:MAG: sialate O-acetylesterase [Cytophagales bacterium]|nr:sialate O-acetylesterase [Cytophagales bacterium]
MNSLNERKLKSTGYVFLFVVMLFALVLSARAEVELPKIFTSNMVLQRDTPIKIWGRADRREKIRIIFLDDTTVVSADKKGNWQAELKELPAGGPFAMIVEGKNRIVLNNILMGDVWICSGQSNMEWPLHATDNAEEEITSAKYPRIRLFTVKRKISTKPLDDCDSDGWVACSPETVSSFSAVGYFFGRKLVEDLDIPIGLINSSWGGTNVETWTSAPSIEKIKGFEGIVDELENYDEEKMIEEQRQKVEALTGPLPDTDLGINDTMAVWASIKTDYSGWKEMELPQLWESAGLINLDGVIWFQKEFELERADLLGEIEIHIGPIDDSDITFLNGNEIGRNIQKYRVPRIYKPEKECFKIGKNVLVVRVEDTGGGGGIYGKTEDLYVKAQNKKISLAGSWKYKIGRGDFSAVLGPNSMPSLLFNAMIHPLTPFGIKGAIWYQGESNVNRAYQYRITFPNLIKNWREEWGLGDFPFFFVQLANYKTPPENPEESAWAELREAQSMALSLSNTGMATIIDIGEANDIHPRNKSGVGRRLALNALNVAYKQEVVHSGPTYKSMELDSGKVIISYEHLGSGFYLKNKYGYVNGFAIAGEDRIFHWAKAQISGKTIVVSCEDVSDPVAVRYGWANNPDDLNLYNLEGLPAVPFRTDEWPGITINNTY